ncbi:hypothetical protein DSECCO2_492980 [anaerobic digester metagenome]
MFVDALENSLLEGALMRPPIGGMLAVHIRKIVFSVRTRHMGKRELQLLRLIMDDGVEVFTPHFFFQQVEQAVSRLVNLIVVVERETGVQIGITPQPGDDEVFVVGIVAEQFGIGDEGHLGTVGFLGRPGLLVHQDSLGEGGTVEGSVPEACDHEVGRKCIHSLGSHPVQADGKLKYIVAVFCTGVDD